jgi:hypothetical protein
MKNYKHVIGGALIAAASLERRPYPRNRYSEVSGWAAAPAASQRSPAQAAAVEAAPMPPCLAAAATRSAPISWGFLVAGATV